MNVEIIADNDDSFTLNPKPLEPEIKFAQMGDFFVACDGKLSCIGHTKDEAVNGILEMREHNKIAAQVIQKEQVVEEIPQPPVDIQRGAPIENHTEVNSFDFFSGTSWAGRKQGF